MNRREKRPEQKRRRRRWPRARWAATRLKIPGPKYTPAKSGSRKQTCSINNGAHSCAPWSPSLQRDCFDRNGNPRTRKGLTSPPLKIRRIDRRAKAGYSRKGIALLEKNRLRHARRLVYPLFPIDAVSPCPRKRSTIIRPTPTVIPESARLNAGQWYCP